MIARLFRSYRPELRARVQASIALSPDPRTQTSLSSASAGTTNQMAAIQIKPARVHFTMPFAPSTKRPPLFGQSAFKCSLRPLLQPLLFCCPGKRGSAPGDVLVLVEAERCPSRITE